MSVSVCVNVCGYRIIQVFNHLAQSLIGRLLVHSSRVVSKWMAHYDGLVCYPVASGPVTKGVQGQLRDQLHTLIIYYLLFIF